MGCWAGNALAVMNVRKCINGNRMHVIDGHFAIRGHRNHMEAINEIFKAGSLKSDG